MAQHPALGPGSPLRLVSDGTGKGTRLFDPKGHEIDLSRCQTITWTVSHAQRIATVTLTFVGVITDVLAGTEESHREP